MEHFLGKEEVIGSIPIVGFLICVDSLGIFCGVKIIFRLRNLGNSIWIKGYERYYTIGVY